MNPPPEGLFRRNAIAGALAWLAFCPAAVLLRGVRWDEACERAQVLAGAVPYPTDHPLYRWSHGAFTIFHDLAALIMRVFPGPFAVGFFQDTLHITAAIIPVFLITAGLAKRTLPAHMAAVFILMGIHLEFVSYYPLSVWPDRFTIAHIGLGYALIVLACLAFERWTLGAFLFGLMPMIHLGLMPELLVLAALVCLAALWRGEKRRVTFMAVAWLAGALLCAVYWFVRHRSGLAPIAPGSPYFSTADPWEAWTRYTQGTDVHRAYARFGSEIHTYLILLAMLYFGIIVSVFEWKSERRIGAMGWLGLFAIIVLAIFRVTLALQPHLSGRTLFLLVGWMPQRLPNTVIPVFVCALAAFAAIWPRSGPHGGLPALTGVLLFGALRPLAAWILPEALYARYIAPPGMLLFLLAGVALAGLSRDAQGRKLPVHVLAVQWLLVIAPLAIEHKSGALYAVAGGALRFACDLGVARWQPGLERRGVYAFAIAAMAACLAPVIGHEWAHRAHLQRTELDRAITAYCKAHGDADAMIVTPGWDNDFQMRTGHPVLATYETQAIASYMPALAASIEQLYTDIYGYRFGGVWHYGLDAWAKRDAAAWRALAQKYGFNYVLSPDEVPLPLAPVLQREKKTFYCVNP